MSSPPCPHCVASVELKLWNNSRRGRKKAVARVTLQVEQGGEGNSSKRVSGDQEPRQEGSRGQLVPNIVSGGKERQQRQSMRNGKECAILDKNERGTISRK